MNPKLTPAESEILGNGRCPDCGSHMLIKGPRGGLSRNVLCGECHAEFNRSLISSERLALTCDPARMEEIYGITAAHYPVTALPARRPQNQKSLDAALAAGCQVPGCTHSHPPLTEIYLKSICHPAAGLSACYLAEGVLVLACHECKRVVVHIAVQP